MKLVLATTWQTTVGTALWKFKPTGERIGNRKRFDTTGPRPAQSLTTGVVGMGFQNLPLRILDRGNERVRVVFEGLERAIRIRHLGQALLGIVVVGQRNTEIRRNALHQSAGTGIIEVEMSPSGVDYHAHPV